MHRLRVVTHRFSADEFNRDPPRNHDFLQGTWLVFFRRTDDGKTIFARVDDIPEHQEHPPRHLTEYSVDSDTFERSTRLAQ
jgi:hypothetical protein